MTYIFKLMACAHMCVLGVGACEGQDIRRPGARITGSCELPGCWELNLGLLGKHKNALNH